MVWEAIEFAGILAAVGLGIWLALGHPMPHQIEFNRGDGVWITKWVLN